MGLDGFWGDLSRIAIIIAVAYVLVLWVAALIWAYRDVSSRTSDTFSQVIAIVLVLVFNLPGLLIYLILRPKQTMTEAYDRQLEAEALLHEIQEQATCPSCRRRIDDDFVSCPYCRTSLRIPCESCGKALATTWVLCPYCAASRAPIAIQGRRPNDAGSSDQGETVVAQKPRRPASTATYTPAATTVASPSDAADA